MASKSIESNKNISAAINQGMPSLTPGGCARRLGLDLDLVGRRCLRRVAEYVALLVDRICRVVTAMVEASPGDPSA